MNKRRFIGFMILFTIFIIDLLTPLTTSVGVLYLCGFLLFLKEPPKIIITFGVLSCSLTVINFILQYNQHVAPLEYFDRIFSVTAIIVATIITLRFKYADQKLKTEKEDYISSLEKMLILTSHRVRRPVANCLGLLQIIDFEHPKADDLKKIFEHMKTSSQELDKFTKDLTNYIYEKQMDQRKALKLKEESSEDIINEES